MKKIIYLLFLSLLFTSCSETYVNGEMLEQKGNIFTFNGEKFNGYAVGITKKNKVRKLIKLENGRIVDRKEYSTNEGSFDELKLNDGTVSYLSDKILYSLDKNYNIEYYLDGTIKLKAEVKSDEEDNISWNGKAEYFDEKGNITKTEFYENGEKIEKLTK